MPDWRSKSKARTFDPQNGRTFLTSIEKRRGVLERDAEAHHR
jgi:hypothetical protein